MNMDVTQVAESTPLNEIEGLDASDVQKGIYEIFSLFRHGILEPTGFARKYHDSVMTYDAATRTFSIRPLNESYIVYVRAKKFVKTTTESFQIPATDNEGLWFFSFDENGVIQGSQDVWDLRNPIAPISTGYWDSDNSIWITENEERHGIVMDADTHRRMHLADGSKVSLDASLLAIINYTESGDGSQNSHAQYGITDGTYFDEDIDVNIVHKDTPTENFEQYLRPYAKLPVY